MSCAHTKVGVPGPLAGVHCKIAECVQLGLDAVVEGHLICRTRKLS